MERYAILTLPHNATDAEIERIGRYLPHNYRVSVWAESSPNVLVRGTDSAGWTLDAYVLPRLASGLIFGAEVPAPTAQTYLDTINA